MLLGKANLNAIEFLLSKALIGIYISHDEFVSVNNVLRENNEKKEEIKNPETSMYPIQISLIQAEKRMAKMLQTSKRW